MRVSRETCSDLNAVSSLALRAPHLADDEPDRAGSGEIAASLESRPSVGAAPSVRHAPSDTLIVAPERTTARVKRPPESAACFPAGSAAPRPAAATHRRAAGIPHGRGRAR